jgi:hypothetical protein
VSVVKKAVKAVGRFVKKYWKQIVIAAAIVFTAGIATVGVAGFSSAAAAAGGGVGGFLSAAGSTMVAGVASIGGTLGIGQGASLAGFGGTGYATLGTGAAAQAMGLAGSNAAMTAGNLARTAPAAALGGGPPAAMAGGAGTSAATAAGRTVVTAPGLAGNAASTAAGTATRAGGFLSNPNAGIFLQAGMGLIGNYMQARQSEEEWDKIKPKGYWGVGLNGEADAQGPLMGAPRDAQGNILPMWTNAPPPPMRTPPNAPEYTGNAALDSGYREPQAQNSFLDPEFDPTAAHIGGRRG